MKKLFLIISLFAFAFIVNGQGSLKALQKKVNLTTPTIISFDTVTNTGTNYLTTLVPISGAYQTVTVQWNGTKLSGTVAGTVTLQGSLDNVNFITVTGTATGVQTGAFTATNVATQSTSWTLVNNPYAYYRVTWTGVGTMAATQTANILAH